MQQATREEQLVSDYALLQALDCSKHEVTAWEAAFLESMLRRGPGYFPTAKQRVIMQQMAEQYLDPHLVAEWCGQQRLFT